tara:strand:+ start:1149 stop:1409 length:261 start_codon:yes stop_codon:yes gene_type:complete
MKKSYLLLVLFTIIFSFTCFSQSNAGNSTNQQPVKKAELKSTQPAKQSIQKKSTIQKAVKVKLIEVEKEKATTTPKQKAKLEDSKN